MNIQPVKREVQRNIVLTFRVSQQELAQLNALVQQERRCASEVIRGALLERAAARRS